MKNVLVGGLALAACLLAAVGPAASAEYAYDSAGRLVRVVSGGVVVTYVYDAAGNRRQIVRSPAAAPPPADRAPVTRAAPARR